MTLNSRASSSSSLSAAERWRPERARMEHRLRQIDRLLMQEALTPSALQTLDAEKRSLLAELEGHLSRS